MPNFHVHWLVAWQALDAIPGAARSGRDSYVQATKTYRSKLEEAFEALSTSKAKGKEAQKAARALFEEDLPGYVDEWRTELYQTDAKREAGPRSTWCPRRAARPSSCGRSPPGPTPGGR